METDFQNKITSSGVAFVDLSAAYNTVWHQGVKLKVKGPIDRLKLIILIYNMLTNKSFSVQKRLGCINYKMTFFRDLC